MIEIARKLAGAGLHAGRHARHGGGDRGGGTHRDAVNKVQEGRPHIVDMIKNGEIALIVNTVEEKRTAVRDSYAIRRAALQQRVALFTTLAGARAACAGMEHMQELRPYVVQELHAQLPAAAAAREELPAAPRPAKE